MLRASAASLATGDLKQRAAYGGGTVPGSITAPTPLPALPSVASLRSATAAASTRKLPAKSRKAITSAPKAKPAFVMKLWTMVNDPKNATYITWMPDGLSFQVLNREQFEKTVLPKYFKHSNFSSFVRQLNMYGWHKVQDVTAGAMQSGEETGQFKSPNFIRGREDLLDNIVRNRGGKGSDDEDELDLHQILEDVEAIRQSQVTMSEQLKQIKEENAMLWDRQQTFSETVEKILRFLASIYGNPSKILGSAENNAIVPMRNGNSTASASAASGPARNLLMAPESLDSTSPILELSHETPVSGSSSPSGIRNSVSSSSAGPAASMSPIVNYINTTNSSATGMPPATSDANFFDMIQPTDNASPPQVGTPHSSFQDLFASTPTNTGLWPSPIDSTHSMVSGLQSLNPDITAQVTKNGQTLDDLQAELELQGDQMEGVQDWISDFVNYREAQ
ncbi:uncharacterized protein V1518DRAFT_420206 [Limtongia smithiae]|uniref:uncharacterized protein n=1 Tax=Limtongia smithiae TaxID=1125753 RepID=UPI0034CD93FB